MSEKKAIRRRALQAMKAVTASAILFAGVACSGDESDKTNFNVGEPDTGNDVSTSNDTGSNDTGYDIGTEDTGTDTTVADTGPDIGPADTGPSDVDSDTEPYDASTDTSVDTGADTAYADADTGQDCNAEESTGDCPDHCTIDDDVDCCQEIGGFMDNGFCAVAVPGPFVPPAMPA